MMRTVFTITVLGTFPAVIERIRQGFYLDAIPGGERYPIVFSTVLHKNKYYVVYESLTCQLVCAAFDTEILSTIYINKVIKLAMKSEFLYKTCLNCGYRMHFPSNFCARCKCSVPLELTWQVPEIETDSTKVK